MRKLGIDYLHNFFKTTKKFEKIFEKVAIKKIEEGRCLAELVVEEEHTNVMGGLHGGLSATLVDCTSSYALEALEKDVPHVSIDIHISYLKGAKIGDKLEVEANVLKRGKNLSFMEVFIRNKDTGDILIKGSHTKYILR